MHTDIIICVRIYPGANMAHDRASVQEIFKRSGGVLRTMEATTAGIHPRILYMLRDTGIIEQLSRGVYRLAAMSAAHDPDLAIVAKRIAKAVVCLISALSIHNMTTQIPHTVHIALPRSARRHLLDYPPIEIHRFSSEIYAAGITTIDQAGTIVQVYGPEKHWPIVFGSAIRLAWMLCSKLCDLTAHAVEQARRKFSNSRASAEWKQECALTWKPRRDKSHRQ
jgi:hypothetical protein